MNMVGPVGRLVTPNLAAYRKQVIVTVTEPTVVENDENGIEYSDPTIILPSNVEIITLFYNYYIHTNVR